MGRPLPREAEPCSAAVGFQPTVGSAVQRRSTSRSASGAGNSRVLTRLRYIAGSAALGPGTAHALRPC